MATVGLVGLGLLGAAVASRLRAQGHEVVGYDVLPEKIQGLVTLGGRGAPSAAAVARDAEAVCTLLPSLASVEEAILGDSGSVAGAPAGLTVIQMSTISPALTRRLAQEVGGRGLSFLDCPVSGTSGMVARGEGMIFVGGERLLAERWRSLLEAILPRAVYVGAAGQAMALKLVANLLVALHTAAAAEALLMAERAGLDPTLALEVLAASAAGSRMLDVRGPMIVRREFPPQMKLDLFMKDLALITEAGEQVDAPLPLTRVAQQLYGAARARVLVVPATYRQADPVARWNNNARGPDLDLELDHLARRQWPLLVVGVIGAIGSAEGGVELPLRGPEPSLADGSVGIDGALEHHLFPVRREDPEHQEDVGVRRRGGHEKLRRRRSGDLHLLVQRWREEGDALPEGLVHDAPGCGRRRPAEARIDGVEVELRPPRAGDGPLVLEAPDEAIEAANLELHAWLGRPVVDRALQKVVEEALLEQPAVIRVKVSPVLDPMNLQPLLRRGGAHEALDVAAQVEAVATPVPRGQKGHSH